MRIRMRRRVDEDRHSEKRMIRASKWPRRVLRWRQVRPSILVRSAMLLKAATLHKPNSRLKASVVRFPQADNVPQAVARVVRTEWPPGMIRPPATMLFRPHSVTVDALRQTMAVP